MSALTDRIRQHVPEQLLELPVWLLHDLHKVPTYASSIRRHGTLDGPEDRAQLVTFERAAAALARSRNASGLGVALGKVDAETIVSGIDLDHCIDEHGVLDPRVTQIMGAAVSYAERSPSGRGAHILGIGDVGTTKTPGLEIYSGQRYLTTTGSALNRAGLADLSDAAALARRLYHASEAVRPQWTAPVIPITRAMARRATEQFAGVIEVFQALQLYRGQRGAIVDVICPWVSTHTAAEISGTSLFVPSEQNAWWGGFKCHHAHCADRTMRDIRAWLRALEREVRAS